MRNARTRAGRQYLERYYVYSVSHFQGFGKMVVDDAVEYRYGQDDRAGNAMGKTVCHCGAVYAADDRAVLFCQSLSDPRRCGGSGKRLGEYEILYV